MKKILLSLFSSLFVGTAFASGNFIMNQGPGGGSVIISISTNPISSTSGIPAGSANYIQNQSLSVQQASFTILSGTMTGTFHPRNIEFTDHTVQISSPITPGIGLDGNAMITINAQKGITTSTLTISSLDCSGNLNSGKLTTSGLGVIVCGDDISGSGGGGGGSALEVFNNNDGTQSSPTASIGLSNAFRGTVSGSTYTFRINSSSIPSRSDVILLQNNLQNGATFFVSSGSVSGKLSVNNATTQNGILLNQTGNAGIGYIDGSKGGALVIDKNSISSTDGLVVISSQATQSSIDSLAHLISLTTSYNEIMLWIQSNSTSTIGANADIRIDANNPDIELQELDQLQSGTGNGKWELAVNNDQFQINQRNSSDSSFQNLLAVSRDGSFRFKELDNGGDYIGFIATTTLSASYVYQLPSDNPVEGASLHTHAYNNGYYDMYWIKDIQNTNTLQNGATFFVIAGRITTPLGSGTTSFIITQNDTSAQALRIISTGTANAVYVEDDGDSGNGSGSSGNVFLNNTFNPGIGLQVYSNNSAPTATNGLVFFKYANAGASQPLLRLDNSGTGNSIKIVEGGNKGTTLGSSGSVLIDNTNNPGIGLQIYSTTSTQTGALLHVMGSSTAWAAPLAIFESTSANSTAVNLRLKDQNPDLEFQEIDQASPAGKFKIDVQNDQLRLLSRNSADNAYELYGKFNPVRTGAFFEMESTGTVRFNDADNSRYIQFKASDTITNNLTFVLPAADGTNGQALVTNGSGNLSFATVSGSGGCAATLPLPPGDTNYIQNVVGSPALQTPSTLWVASGTVNNLNVSTLTVSKSSTFQNIGITTFQNATSMTFGNDVAVISSTATKFMLPNGSTPISADCDAEAERGRIYIDTDATSGRQVYVCEGGSGWVLQGDGNSGGGGGGYAVEPATVTFQLNKGFIASTGTFTSLSPGVMHTLATSSNVTTGLVSLSTEVTGTLPVSNGGTGANTLSLYGSLYGNGTSAIGAVVAGSAGLVLTSQLAGPPVWSASTGGSGASTLAVGTGTASNFTNNVTTPTAAISADGSQFHSTALGTTNYLTIFALPAATISAGSLGSGVIASSVAVNTVDRAQLKFSSIAFTSSYKAAICQGPNVSLGFSGFAASTPTATCVNTSSAVFGVASFTDVSTMTVQDHFHLPSDWVGAIDANIVWKSTQTTGNVVWQVRTSCVADGEVSNTSWNAASTVTDAAKGTTNQFNTASITGITTTNCSADEELFFDFYRDPNHASDTLNATADLVTLQFTIRRTF